ncbi:MAG: glycosyltransferase [Streptosporangiales bacterium]|nr:glycosyltransferase [Streptosporangiales bacterium]
MTSGARDSGSDRVLVVIPTYNESMNIEAVVGRLRAAVPHADVLVVDDGSPDGTGEIADRIAARDDAVHVLHRAVKEGLGRAYVAGFRWGFERHYDVLVEMDADGSHQPEELPRLLEAIADADVVIGSRWVPGGVVRNWPWHRELISRAGNVYARLALGIPVRDATAGFRAYRSVVLEKVRIDEVVSVGYCFQIDLVLRALRAGFRVVEVPIEFVERTEGESKMGTDVVVEAFARVTLWGLRHPFGGGRP